MSFATKAEESRKVNVVPCSGIGKTYGSVSRLAAYVVTEDLLPERTCLVALSRLVMGDESAREAISGSPAITIDGCSLACATKMVRESGGELAGSFAVLDVYRRHRQLKPKGIAELNEAGEDLARVLAHEVVETIAQLSNVPKEGQHG
jgi:uncharacterized metal-binding protein